MSAPARWGALAAVLGLLAAAAPARAVHPGTRYSVDPRSTGLVVEDVHFPSTGDSVRLNGWWFAGRPNMPVLVVCPRGAGTMADMVPSVVEWSRHGYAVLTFDLRDFGPDGPGDVDSLASIVFASRWVDDTAGALAYARSRAAGQPVFAWGQDLGGPLALAAAARRRGSVDGLAVEGLFRSAQEQLMWLGAAQDPDVVRRHYVLVRDEDNPAAAMTRLTDPLLVVLAMKDEVTPPDVTRQLLTTANANVTTWMLPNATHDGAERTPGYFDHLADWFAQTAIQLRRPHRRLRGEFGSPGAGPAPPNGRQP